MKYASKLVVYVALSLFGIWLIGVTSEYLKVDYATALATTAFCNTVYILVMK